MNRLDYAIYLAADAHLGQTDKSGETYLLHPLAVMEMVRPHGKKAMIVGVLHDALEDVRRENRARLNYNIDESFTPDIVDALDNLTHRDGETYDDYIDRVATRWLSTIVKIADLTHNMDPRRIPASQIVDKDFARWDKYRRALIRLERTP